MGYPTFEFVRDEVMKYCEELGSYEEEIEYLEWIKTEYGCRPPRLDPNTRHPVPFVEFIEKQIRHRRGCIERDKKAAEEEDDLCSITGDRGSIVRIFEAMKKVGIIETTTDPKYIVKIFFRDKKLIRDISKYYSNKSKEIEQLGTKTNNLELVEFIKKLAEDSFGGKKEILQDIRRHLSHLEEKP